MLGRSTGRRVVVVAAAALLAGLLTYRVTAPDRVTDPVTAQRLLGPTATPTGTAAAPASPAPSRPATAWTAAPAVPATEAPAPTRLSVPALGATLRVQATGVDADGQMAIPSDPSVAGWYRFGPRPGDPEGSAVLAAHVDNEGRVGPLARLAALRPGDRVTVTAGTSTVVYAVTRVDRYAKRALDLRALFDRSGPPRLHLVTCGGAFDRSTGHYEDNVVAIAEQVSP